MSTGTGFELSPERATFVMVLIAVAESQGDSVWIVLLNAQLLVCCTHELVQFMQGEFDWIDSLVALPTSRFPAVVSSISSNQSAFHEAAPTQSTAAHS